MKRQGLMLSALTEQMLGIFRYMFYRKTPLSKDDSLTIHGLSMVVKYIKRGWPLDQRLGGGFRMVFEHYALRADPSEYGKYDHIITLTVRADEIRAGGDEGKKKTLETRKNFAREITAEIEAHLVASGIAVELELEDPSEKIGRQHCSGLAALI
jgi:hypothetical protein